MIIGNLTRNPVLKTTNSGSTVCTFGIATNTTWKNSEGNLQERTEFHNVVSWNKLAEICAQILAMGMLVFVEGELRTRVWDDDNGVRHYKTEVKVDDMKLLDNKDKQGVGIDAAREASNDRRSDNKADSEDKDKEEKEDKAEKKETDKVDKVEEKGEDKESDGSIPSRAQASSPQEKEIEKEAEDLF